MVYFGISKGCETCKKKKKKCDGTKPECNVCQKKGRRCLGYKDSPSLVFRYYVPARPDNSIAKEGILGPIGRASEVDDADWFIKNFVVEPSDKHNSRGFLNGIRIIMNSVLPSSDLARAASAVSMACKANLNGDSAAQIRAAEEYGDVLRSFRTLLLSKKTPWSVQTLVTAVLLGLYEVVNNSQEPLSAHNVHIKGVCALMAETRPALSMSADVELLQLSGLPATKFPLIEPRLPGILCAPITCCVVLSLDGIIIECRTLFDRAAVVLSNTGAPPSDIESLYEDAWKADQKCSHWSLTRFSAWRPQTVGFIPSDAIGVVCCGYCAPGPVLRYSDLYIAAVWNTYRKTHLMILDILYQCSIRFNDTFTSTAIQQRVANIANSLAASVPFHLAQNLEQYVNASKTGSEISIGKSVGGLLLIHPLYVAAKFAVVPFETRMYFRRCLAWIGRHMGIGLASQMSTDSMQGSDLKEIQSTIAWNTEFYVPFKHMMDTQSLIWAGMLLQTASVADKFGGIST